MVDSMVIAIYGRSRVVPILVFPLGEGVLCACCEMMCEGVKAHVVYYCTSRTDVSRGKLGNLGEKGRKIGIIARLRQSARKQACAAW